MAAAANAADARSDYQTSLRMFPFQDQLEASKHRRFSPSIDDHTVFERDLQIEVSFNSADGTDIESYLLSHESSNLDFEQFVLKLLPVRLDYKHVFFSPFRAGGASHGGMHRIAKSIGSFRHFFRNDAKNFLCFENSSDL